jgi:YidC/Oxa1 family membrane protein insertase
MRQHLPNVLVFVVLAAALTAGWWYVDKTFFPKPPAPPPVVKPSIPAKESVGALASAAALAPPPAPPTRDTLYQSVIGSGYAGAEVAMYIERVKKVKAARVAETPELIALGDASFRKQVLLTTKGGAVQQVILRDFDEANRLGLEVKQADGTTQPLRIIPGVDRPRVSLTALHSHPHADRLPNLAPGRVPADLLPLLTEPSYVLLHYAGDGDEHPSPELGDRTWTVVERHQPADGSPWRAVFETTLEAPYFLKLRKTYTLAPDDYHIGLKLDLEPIAPPVRLNTGMALIGGGVIHSRHIKPFQGREKGVGKFKYQIAGPHQLPIEGEWYTPTYRNVLIGWLTGKGAAKRTIEDAGTITTKHGGDPVYGGGHQLTYAAVGTSHFASALAIDDTQPAEIRQGMWDHVTPTREPHAGDNPDQPFLADVTFRAVAKTLDPAPDETIHHQYLIYDGPIKVRLLYQMGPRTQGRPVSDDLVNRYLYNLTLRTLTDAPSPNVLGRFANAIYWSDLVITFTNLMHTVLGWLHILVGSWGVSIILLTVMVRLILLMPSRKQQIMMARMQEKMAKMKPELDKVQEKYKNDPQRLQQEKAKLMFQHGVNPLSTMGGCLMLFAQMPIFMGLYYCLQESVFFRLKDFLWIPNLAAPDMLLWWGQGIPWVSSPDSLGGSLYLGPYFNILPLLAVALIFLQQKLTMPPPTDEQQEMQQRMMKIMIVVMAVFFYKMPAGLCLYFICSTSWALAERKLSPKPKAVKDAGGGTGPTGGGVRPTGPTKPNEPPPANGSKGGGFMARMRAKFEEMQRQADEQAQRQIRREPPPRGPGKPNRRKK